MHKTRPPIGYRTAAGNEVYETMDGEYYVLAGWDGERYISCYKCNWFGARSDEKHYILTPLDQLTFDDFDRVVPIGYIVEE